mmetsp:Transcript_7280/g.8260  ORF Transcript_7280/g.8260 Transcript_7280/m.8260 type:complete len:114 (-) Transcript_7280:10-351(-)
MGGSLTSTTLVLVGEFDVDTTIFYLELPTSAQFDIHEDRLCYQSDLLYYPPTAIIKTVSKVKECWQDVERAARTGDYSWVCDYNSPMEILLFNNTAGAPTRQNVAPKTCWTVA